MPGPTLGRVVRYGLAAASVGAGLIHASAASDHGEHAAQLAFFVSVALLQVLWGLAVLRWAAGLLLVAGAALNSAVVAIWVLSRTAGLPGVPGADHVEPVGFKDGVSSLLELVLVLSLAGLLPRAAGRLRVASAPMASWFVVAAVGVLTAAAVAAPGHQHDETGHTHTGPAGTAAHSDDGHAHTPAELAAPGHGDDGHTHEVGDVALAPHDHDGDGHAHDGVEVTAPGHRHDGDDSAHDSVLLIAAGHHHEPGHVHSPEHHHAESTDPGEGHGAAHDDGTAHDHGAGTAPEQGSGHDHEAAPGHHDGGGHEGGDHDHCHEAAPGNPLVTTAQETARALGLGCLATHTSLHIPTAEPRSFEAGVD